MISDARIINVVDRYLAVEIARDLNSEAGFRAEHQIGRLMDYRGQLPESGHGGNSNGAMIYQVGMMFKEPRDRKTLWACRVMTCLHKRNPKHHAALVAWVLLKNRPDPDNEADYHTDARIAAALQVSRSAFLNNLKAGKGFVSDMVEISEVG
ncbi:hypothetical protein [Aliamphritea hakodatensis]|uniref:hypothetical protein n=1 Tax=Aliamphritea hakodatensis TaxID=2895352 RepID=UPI0022FD4D13|nr:hypothetical protein [Aliamphritea hakodatensis]